MEERVTDPYCIVCGGLVGFEEVYGKRSKTWKYWEIVLDPANPLEWGGIYRAVFQPEPGSRFRLSGTGRYDGRYYDGGLRDYLKVVWERDSSNIDRPQANDPGEADWFIDEMNFLDSTNHEQYPHGYVVHACCWTFVERMVGPEAEDNLELLLDICRERFHENPYDIHEYRDLRTDEPTSQPTYRWWDPLTLASSLDAGRHHHPDVQRDPRQSIPLRNPLDIPDIRRLIRHSAQNKARETTKRKTRRWSSMITASSSSSSSTREEHPRSIRYYQVTELLPELVMMILDNLSRTADIRNAITAFHWQVPDVYWKARVPSDLVFELQEEKERLDEFDWKFLGLGLLELMEQPNLRNRKRVLGLVDEIRRRFWERSGMN